MKVTLTGAEVCHIVSEWLAKREGVALPVSHRGRWLAGDGEVRLELTIESVPNVRQLDTVRLGRRRR